MPKNNTHQKILKLTYLILIIKCILGTLRWETMKLARSIEKLKTNLIKKEHKKSIKKTQNPKNTPPPPPKTLKKHTHAYILHWLKHCNLYDIIYGIINYKKEVVTFAESTQTSLVYLSNDAGYKHILQYQDFIPVLKLNTRAALA